MALRMESNTPVRKVTAVGIAGAITTLLVFVLNTYVLDPGKQITPDAAAALTTVLAFLAGYFTRPGEGERVLKTR